MRFIRVLILCLLLGPSVAPAQGPVKISPESDLDVILDALEARGKDLKDFSADVTLTTVSERTGAESSQTGKVVYQERGAGDARIRVSFDKRKLENGATQPHKVDYLLDQGNLTDRDYAKKLEVKRQVIKPGQKMNLLKLGEGPFPLPIGQSKEEVKKQFEVTKVAPAADDPKGTVHVKLVPRAGSQFEKRFRSIDVYLDPATNMPARIDTSEKPDTARMTELRNLKTNSGVRDEQFALPNIDGQAGWNRREEAFE
jgi:outer membrane lipoprotein-sorting protein